MSNLTYLGYAAGSLFFVWFVFSFCLGIVIIEEDKVGIVTKKFGTKSLPPGRIIALNGEAGIQADTLTPGLKFWYFPWQYVVNKVPIVSVKEGELGLVMAIDGDTIPSKYLLAKKVDSDNFQNAVAFFKNGGQKGKQIAMLTAGQYRLNTSLFALTSAKVTTILPEEVGIITTSDGAPLENGEIAGGVIEGHNNFQDVQEFINAGGRRGLQEQVVLAGQWNFNTWFVSVKKEKMTEIPISSVGVVTSFVGKKHVDLSGESFKHGDLVETGHKGVLMNPLHPGRYALNLDTVKVIVVPTSNIVLNWADNINEAHRLDEKLSSITVRSKDGFSFSLDCSVVIHIGAVEASKVISRMGSVEGLISQVLEPTIGAYFRNAAQKYAALDFLSQRAEMQETAREYVANALKDYDVQAVNTLIGDLLLPDSLLKTQTEKKIAEEMKTTYKMQEESQKQKEALDRQTAITDMQKQVVNSEQGVRIAELNASQKVREAEGQTKVNEQNALQKIKIAEAESKANMARAEGEAAIIEKKLLAEAKGIEAKGISQAKSYNLGVLALGKENFTAVQVMDIIGRNNVKVIPDLVIGQQGADGQGGLSGIMSAVLAQVVYEKIKKDKAEPVATK